MVKHRLDPALTMKQVEADLTAQKLGYKEVSLPLQVLDNTSVHLRKELIQRRLIVAGLLDDIKSGSRDLSVLNRGVMRQEGQTPVVEIVQSATV